MRETVGEKDYVGHFHGSSSIPAKFFRDKGSQKNLQVRVPKGTQLNEGRYKGGKMKAGVRSGFRKINGVRFGRQELGPRTVLAPGFTYIIHTYIYI